jgi:hypothetical protein
MSMTATNDTRASAEGDKSLSAKFWHSELDAAAKRDEKWHKRATKVVERYRDERGSDDRTERRTNILWSNTEVLKSVLFQGIGNPDVRRRFPRKGKEERAARQASLVLEHGLSYCADSYDSSGAIECAVEDMLLPGLGQCWLVYDAEIEEEPASNDNEATEDAEMVATGITDQRVYFEHVYWQDYRTSAGRKEADIWWKARRHQYSRDELNTYFPKDGEKIPLEASIADRPTDKNEDDDTFKRANVWEIWDKTKRERVYVAEGYPTILRKDEDPYQLSKFFPCPEPLYSVKTTSSLIPIPEYTLYQDQADELDRITTRLSNLIEALKRRGVYDASMEGAENQLSGLADAGDNEFLPYKGFVNLAEKGGLKGVFATEDLKPIIDVVAGLYEQRAQLVQTIYEVTGISDVIRGSSNPNETATAQRIKGQFGSLRIQKRQSKVQTFIRDLFRLKAEILAEHFEREKLEDMTGVDMPLQSEIAQAEQQLAMIEQQQQMAQQAQQQPQPGVQAMGANGGPPMDGMPGQASGNGMAPMPPQPPPMPMPSPEQMAELEQTAKAVSWEEIASILKSDDRRGYKVDIETEATVNVDEQMEKQNRIEMLGTMQGFLEKMIPAVMQMPELANVAKEMCMFTLKSFKAGRTLEETFDDFFDKLSKRPPPQQQGDPVADAKAKEIETKTQIAVKTAEGNAKAKQVETQANLQMKAADLQGKQEERLFDRQIRQEELADKREDRQYDLIERAQEAAANHQERQQDAVMARADGVMSLQERRQKMAQDEALAKQRAQQKPQGN